MNDFQSKNKRHYNILKHKDINVLLDQWQIYCLLNLIGMIMLLSRKGWKMQKCKQNQNYEIIDKDIFKHGLIMTKNHQHMNHFKLNSKPTFLTPRSLIIHCIHEIKIPIRTILIRQLRTVLKLDPCHQNQVGSEII